MNFTNLHLMLSYRKAELRLAKGGGILDEKGLGKLKIKIEKFLE